ncbi:MAG: tetratricopeptide repeat protein [Bacteroidia bacterium]|nr:tetratricopeptide repeat protein [Bacteroidia bacterium]
MSNNKAKEKSGKGKKAKAGSNLNTGWIRLILVISVFILYGNSTKHQYTLDDDIFYLKHSSVQKGFSGVSELFAHGSMVKFDGTIGEQPYRPVTLLSFAIEKELFNNNATSSHWINLLLYILVLQILLSLLLRLFPAIDPGIIGVVVLLFAAHPIHSEVVASIKSRDELLAALFGFMAWLYTLPKVQGNPVSMKMFFVSLFCFALALFSKESAITLALLIPLSHFMILSTEKKELILKFAGFFTIAILFLALRFAVIGSGESVSTFPVHENILTRADGVGEATATRMEILFYYLKLLFVPYPLSWDYSFNQIPVMDWSDLLPWISLVLYATLLILAIYLFRKKPVLSFAILFYLIALSPVSNILILNLSSLGERFLFFPSLGFAIALTFVLTSLFKLDTKSFSGQKRNVFVYTVTGLLILYSGLTISRSAEWKTNLTLFESGVISSPNSSRAHYSLATEYNRQAAAARDPRSRSEFTAKALQHYNRSLEIFPGNVMTLYNLGNTQCLIGDTNTALKNYRKAVELDPAYLSALNNLSGVYMSRNQLDSALFYLKQGYTYNKTDVNIMSNIAAVSFMAQNYSQTIEFADKVLTIDKQHRKSYGLLIDANNRLGNTAAAERYRAMMNSNIGK